MEKFIVEIVKTIHQKGEMEITAESEEEALMIAYQKISSGDVPKVQTQEGDWKIVGLND